MSETPQKSVTEWIVDLKAGDDKAAERLWQRYFDQLVQLARRKLAGAPKRANDEEDIAIIAFNSFCQRAAQGRFPRLADRDDLWQILLMLAERKVVDLWKHEARQKRGGGKVRGESALLGPNGESTFGGIGQAIGPEPTPQFAAMLAEEFECRLRQLDDEVLRRVAVLKMEGCTNSEIAKELDCAVRTVDRKLRTIREIWSQENGS